MKNLDKTQTYIIGVSGGADSMALLNMCKEHNLNIIVAHMNYLKRESANRDEQIVIDYCEKNHIKCEVKHQLEPCNENFQAFARKKRYAFYEQLMKKYQASKVLLAHHLDDHIETYLMQQQRNSQSDYYGIAKEVYVHNCLIYRPLLKYEKKALVDYCHKHHVPYGIDESNLTKDYTRNKIRHEIIALLTSKEKKVIEIKIAQLNNKKQNELKQLDEWLQSWENDVESLMSFDEEVAMRILERWIYLACLKHYSRKEIKMIYNMCKKDQFQRSLQNNYEIELAYGILYIYEKKGISYQYEINALEEMDTPYFKLRKSGQVIEGIYVKDEELPLIIREYRNDDKIKLRIGTKKINRFFIDRKIPKHLRKNYPVVVNNVNEVIFITGIGCEISHFSNNPNIFVVQ